MTTSSTLRHGQAQAGAGEVSIPPITTYWLGPIDIWSDSLAPSPRVVFVSVINHLHLLTNRLNLDQEVRERDYYEKKPDAETLWWKTLTPNVSSSIGILATGL